MFKYWTTGNLKYLTNELNSNDDKIKLNTDNLDEAKEEYCLIKIYDYIIKRQNYNITEIFEKYQNYLKDNYFNLSRLKILYGKYLCKNHVLKMMKMISILLKKLKMLLKIQKIYI
jgi:hypothetical protein